MMKIERSLTSSENSLSSSVHDSVDSQPREPVYLQRPEEPEKQKPPPSRVTTNSSLKSQTVPHSERRGLLSLFCLIPEYQDARECPESLKRGIVCIIAMAAIIGPMGTSIIFPVIGDVTDQLDTSVTIVNVSVGIYLLLMGIFPIWWSSISERVGRRTVYIVSFTLLVGFCIGAALSKNISLFIVFRMLMGASSLSVQSIGSGGINDLYRSQELGRAMSMFYLGTLLAPFLSPIIGGAIGMRWGFRGTCWFMVAFAGVLLVMIVLFLPETLRRQDSPEAIARYLAQLNEDTKKYNQGGDADNNALADDEDVGDDEIRSIITALGAETDIERHLSRSGSNAVYGEALSRVNTVDRNQAQQLQQAEIERVKTELSKLRSGTSVKKTKLQRFRHTVYLFVFKPAKSVVFLRYPPVLIMLIYSAVSFMCLYFVNLSITYEYLRPPYSFLVIIVGLCYIPNSLSYILTSCFSGRWVDKLLKDFEKKHGFLSPEARISWNCYTAALILPISLLIMGWCWDQHTHWIVPMVGTFLWGAGSLLVINTTVTYTIDSLPGKGATGVALNNLLRQTLATVACFVQEPLTKALGVGVLYSILAGILLAFGSTLIVAKRYSSRWRENYDLQKLYKIVDQ